MSSGIVEWIVGSALVLVYGYGRFHTPKTVVGTTTMYRYYMAQGLYFGAQLLLFFFLAVLVASSPGVIKALEIGAAAGTIPQALTGISTPIMAALLMTALLPNLPLLSTLDAWVLRQFQDLGHIPLEVRIWRDRLVKSELNISDGALAQMRRKLAEDPLYSALAEVKLTNVADGSPQYQFTRLMYLMGVIDDFSVARGNYPRALVRFEDEYLALKQDFGQAILRAARYFRATKGHDDATAATPAMLELKRGFCEQCETSYREMCQMLARGILMSEATQRARGRKLESLGFSSVEEAEARLDINQVLTVSSVVALILFAGIALINGPGGSHAIIIPVMVAAIYGAAVVCALAPKAAWGFADIGDNGERPVWAYLLSGVLGVGCAITVSVAFKSFMLEGWLMGALRDTRLAYPWYLLSFCVAVLLAAFADNWRGRGAVEPRWGRYAEGLALAVLLAAAFVVVRAMIEQIPNVAPQRIPDMKLGVVMAVIGLFLGASVPHWYRKVRAQPDSRPTAEPVEANYLL